MKSSIAKTVFLTARPPFLILTPACIFIAYGLAVKNSVDINLLHFCLIMLAGLSAHISVNTLNEYQDYKSGLDLTTIKTPFSGGSGALVNNSSALNHVLITGIISLTLTIVIGLYFIAEIGVELLPLGLLGVLIVLAYTPWLNQQAWLCLIAPGLAFGPLMVIGSYFVMANDYSLPLLIISLIPFFLVNNLLLLNQLPDIAPDKKAGRNHFFIRYGIRSGLIVYRLFILASLITILLSAYVDVLPTLALLASAPVLVVLIATRNIETIISETEKLQPLLAINVVTALITPAILTITLIFA